MTLDQRMLACARAVDRGLSRLGDDADYHGTEFDEAFAEYDGPARVTVREMGAVFDDIIEACERFRDLRRRLEREEGVAE